MASWTLRIQWFRITGNHWLLHLRIILPLVDPENVTSSIMGLIGKKTLCTIYLMRDVLGIL